MERTVISGFMPADLIAAMFLDRARFVRLSVTLTLYGDELIG
jgi:hypothetical protein